MFKRISIESVDRSNCRLFHHRRTSLLSVLTFRILGSIIIDGPTLKTLSRYANGYGAKELEC